MSRLTLGLCTLFALLGACALVGLRLNLSGSMPVGLYLVVPDAPVRGSIVLACLPIDVAQLAMERGYIPRAGSCPGGAMPIGKPVLGVPGDTIVVTTTGLTVNGASVLKVERLSADRKKRLLPQLPTGQYVVGPNELWLVSEYSQLSFDSRYFGPVNAAEVRAQLRPLWILKSRP